MEIQFHGDLEIDPTRDMHFLPMALKDSHFENFSDLPPRLDGGRKDAGRKDSLGVQRGPVLPFQSEAY